jgi:arabinogalactan endo-1,4-beta-galactosidase
MIIPGRPAEFINGADVSHLQQIEDFGGKFYDRQGREQDCLKILKDHGVNYIRLKIWNKPGLPNSDPAGYNNKAHVLKMARRVKNMGFKLLLNFHYSDWWTDPGKQFMPVDWEGLDFPELNKALYDFTHDVVQSLAEQGTTPDMVQVGNEITNGMLWDEAKVSDEFDTGSQWDKLCVLLKSGLSAVKDVSGSIKTVIHIERGGDNARSVYFFDNLKKRGVEFDIIGLSYYSIWHGSISAFRQNVFDLAERYGKGIAVVETAYPYTGENGDDTPNSTSYPYSSLLPEYPATIQGQANNLQAVASVLKKIPDGKGLGFFYWQPDFIPVKGAGWKYGEGCEWDDQTMFDFKGRALWSLDVFRMHASDIE